MIKMEPMPELNDLKNLTKIPYRRRIKSQQVGADLATYRMLVDNSLGDIIYDK